MRETLKLSLTTAPVNLPLSLYEAKAHLRLDDSDTTNDALIMGLVRSAGDVGEKFTGRAFITQTWTLFRDTWPRQSGKIWEGTLEGPETWLDGPATDVIIPRPPLQSVVHVKTFDDSDVETVWSTTNYFVDTTGEPGRIVPRKSVAFPTAERVANAIEIQFIAGYGDDPDSVPEAIRQGMLEMVEKLYDGCEVKEAMTSSRAAALWTPYRVVQL